MLFTSVTFIIFFTVTFSFYYLVPHNLRWIILLSASFVFYIFAVPVHALVLAFAILFNYFTGIELEKNWGTVRCKQLFWLGISVNILLLAGFKYFNALDPLLLHVFGFSSHDPSVAVSILIPLGISFYTFTNISYLIEVKRKKIAAERHPGYFALYISFFPKLLQGPIERPGDFIPQVSGYRPFDYGMAAGGLRLVLLGFLKKMVVADNLSPVVGAFYDNPANHTGPLVLAGTLLFAFQLYFDFSGYTDIARGLAKILGLSLVRNFRRPYAASSVRQFWNRWHISFSLWLRDYVFLPTAYYISRKLKNSRYLFLKTELLIYAGATILTFTICGIWHGTGWNFLVWGWLFGFYLIVANFLEKPKKRIYKKLGGIDRTSAVKSVNILITFMLVSFTWLFFRAGNLNDAGHMLSGLTKGWDAFFSAPAGYFAAVTIPGLQVPQFIMALVIIAFTGYAEYLVLEKQFYGKFMKLPSWIRWGTYFAIVYLLLVFGNFDHQTFVYSQF